RPQIHRQLVEAVEAAGVGEMVVAEPLAEDGQGLEVARVVDLGIGFLAPEVGLHYPAPPDADLQTSAAQVVEQADLLDQTERMVEGEDVDARAEAHARGALGHAAEEHVLRGRQAVDGGGVVLGEVISVEAGAIEALDLHQPLSVDLVESLARHLLDVNEHSLSERHGVPPSRHPTRCRGPARLTAPGPWRSVAPFSARVALWRSDQ